MKKIILTILLLAFCVSISGAGITDKLRAVIAARNVPAPGGTPAWGGEVQRSTDNWGDSNPVVITLSGGISAGDTAVLCFTAISIEHLVTGVTDSKGNTWAVDAATSYSSNPDVAIAHAYISTALVTTDTISVTMNDVFYSPKGWALFYLTDVASSGQPDNAESDEDEWAQTVSLAGSTTATNTVAIGIIAGSTASLTYSGDWTQIGDVLDLEGDKRFYFLRATFSSAGTQNPGGTWTTEALSQANAWVSYK